MAKSDSVNVVPPSNERANRPENGWKFFMPDSCENKLFEKKKTKAKKMMNEIPDFIYDSHRCEYNS